MQFSEAHDKIIPALVKAQHAIGGLVSRDEVGLAPDRGGGRKYAYSSLASVLATVAPALTEQDLAILQDVHTGDQKVSVTTVILHSSGQTCTFAPFVVPVDGSTPQRVGSACTYARRYGLMAALNLAAADDDGADASQTHAKLQNGAQKRQPAPRAAKPGPEAQGTRKPKDRLPGFWLEMEKLLGDAEDWRRGVETFLRTEKSLVKLDVISPERDEALKATFAFFNGLDPEARGHALEAALAMAAQEEQEQREGGSA